MRLFPALNDCVSIITGAAERERGIVFMPGDTDTKPAFHTQLLVTKEKKAQPPGKP